MMSVTSSFSDLIKFIRSETDHHLHKIEIPSEPEYVYSPIRYVLKGKGKRLRPVLVHLSGRGFDADPLDLMQAAMAVELLHNFTLIHDDIMDNDDTRHGQPAVHKKFGQDGAILAGDSMFTMAQLMIGQVGENTVPAFTAFNQAALAVCEGQALDLQFERDTSVTLDQYLDMVGKKTGALISVCAELGGILGRESDETLMGLRYYGTNLGKAFQIQDDMLELYSDEDKLGKSTHSDIQSDKQTILSILARNHDGRAEIQSEDPNEKQAALREFYETTGIRERALELCGEYVKKANDSLNVFNGEHKDNMEQFTSMVLNRKH